MGASVRGVVTKVIELAHKVKPYQRPPPCETGIAADLITLFTKILVEWSKLTSARPLCGTKFLCLRRTPSRSPQKRRGTRGSAGRLGNGEERSVRLDVGRLGQLLQIGPETHYCDIRQQSTTDQSRHPKLEPRVSCTKP